MEEIQQTEKFEPQIFSQGSDSTAMTTNEKYVFLDYLFSF